MHINMMTQQVFRSIEDILNEKVLTESQDYDLNTMKVVVNTAFGLGVGIISLNDPEFELLYLTDYINKEKEEEENK